MARIFVYDGREFPDPDPKMTADEVRQSMVNFFPELANADTTSGKRKTKENPALEDDTFEFKRRTGTKGR
ncbi:MAG: PRTRC system protein C [Dehalococcoidales bacterium]|nr:PRTRC system protein C [Dehalococcoidales bacterium]